MATDEVDDEWVVTELPSSLNAPQLARGFLRATLETWKLDGFGEITELLASELVSNVVLHVDRPFTLRIARHPSSIRVEVADASTEPPILRQPDPGESTGRGVFILNAFADQWGTDLRENGKTVWFELDVATATDEAHGSAD